MDPLSDSDLIALARKSRAGSTLSSNEAAELSKAQRQAGPLGRRLTRIIDGKE
jgi:hypothetical protein